MKWTTISSLSTEVAGLLRVLQQLVMRTKLAMKSSQNLHVWLSEGLTYSCCLTVSVWTSIWDTLMHCATHRIKVLEAKHVIA